MLACISDVELNVHETLSTLQYACRARFIQNRVSANVSSTAPDLAVEDSTGLVNLTPTSRSDEADAAKEIETSLLNALKSQLASMEAELVRMRSSSDQALRATWGANQASSSGSSNKVCGNKLLIDDIESVLMLLGASLQLASCETSSALIHEPTMLHVAENCRKSINLLSKHRDCTPRSPCPSLHAESGERPEDSSAMIQLQQELGVCMSLRLTIGSDT